MTQPPAANPAAATDRIERSVLINAPRSRVWQSLANAEAFSEWFGANLKGQMFRAGQRAQGPITIPGYQHMTLDIVIERVEPETLLSYRWHPYAIDAAVDYSKEEPTLVTFTLADAPDGTLLTVVESGFDKVPPARRLEAFRMNSAGWEGQMRNIQRHAAAR
jgi:uncharacterized protein YndB with AHSA1/START domain